MFQYGAGRDFGCVRLIEQRNEIGIDDALIKRVKIRIRYVEIGRKLYTDEAPVPGFKHIVAIVLRIGEDEAVAMSISGNPSIGRFCIKPCELSFRAGRNEIYSGAELMLRVALLRRKLVRRASAIGNRILSFERFLTGK